RAAGGEPLEACLGAYPAAYRAELRRLVPAALRVRSLGQEPSAAFQARLERELVERVDRARRGRRGVGGRLDRFLSRRRLLSAAAIAAVALVVLFGGGAGVLQAADESLPDSPLYEVKGAREAVQLFLVRDPETRVGLRAGQVGQRGRELERAVATNRRAGMIDLLAGRPAGATGQKVEQTA